MFKHELPTIIVVENGSAVCKSLSWLLELRLNHIKDMDSSNHYLKDVFIPSYWDKNIVVAANNSASEFMPITGHVELGDIFILKEHRKIRNDHTFS
jgi:hypothetical protein